MMIKTTAFILAGMLALPSLAAAETAKAEAERELADRTGEMEIAEAQAKLAEAVAQLQAMEHLRKNLKR